MPRPQDFPLGAAVTLEELSGDPHPLLARLREREPVSWLPALGGWLVTRYDLAVQVMRDARRFTVEDPRFSTGQIVGPSMLSLDGPEHERHRTPFVAPFRPSEVRERFTAAVEETAQKLIDGFIAAGRAELRSEFAAPLAAGTMAHALGLGAAEVPALLERYRDIVAGVTEITAGGDGGAGHRAFSGLSERLRAVIGAGQGSLLAAAAAGAGGRAGGRGARLSEAQVISNAAVLLFGGIETTEGMIASALLHLLEDPRRWARVREEPDLLAVAIEESLRLDPAAAVVDRYATEPVALAGTEIGERELVRVSLTAANRDPTVFQNPDDFDLERPRTRQHLAFAHGPHVCLGVHLARLEARTGLGALLRRLPSPRLEPDPAASIRGLVFRKPAALPVSWSRPRPAYRNPADPHADPKETPCR